MQKILFAFFLSLAMALPARAGMIGTPAAPESERERVKAMLERPEVAAEMHEMGIAPQEAEARVDAMSDAEVRALAGRLDTVPAGGQVGDRTLLLILLVILLVLLL